MIMTLSLLLLFLRHIAVSTADVSLSDIEWVVSDRKGESYPQACQRRSLDTLPINNNSYFTWNESTFRRVVDEVLEMQSWKYNYGIEGCCVTGLWCFTNNTCFTQGYGRDFSNYGWLLSDGTADARPVYSCIASRDNADKFNSWKSLQTVESSAGSVVCDVSLHGMELTLNSISDSVLLSPSSTAYIGGNACGNIEVCRSIACKGDEDCPVSNMCFENYCAPICSVNIEKGDMSCACDYTCTAPSSTSTFGVCLPRSTGVGTNVMTCSSSKLVDTSWIMVDGRVSTTLSIVTDQLQVHDITVDNKAHAYCNSDVDCQDGDVCTEDTCDRDSRYCSYSFLPDCDSTDPAIRERSTTFAYHSFYSAVEAIASNQSVAVSFLMRNGQLSSTSNVDGKPEQAIHLPFSFVFFNNIVDMAYISPKGMIILPPHDCNRMWKYDLGSGSNIVAPYCADWNTTSQLTPSSSNSGIWHYFQKRGDPVDKRLFAVDADAFHVLFFELSILTTQRPLVTFISSMYSDGSIRFSYVTTAVSDDLPYLFIGLLGAYSSNAKNSYHRYKEETVDQSWVESGNSSEVVFCPVTVSTCPMEVCLSPGDQLVLRWDGSLSCEAFGKDFLFRVVCSWGGGIGSTTATHSSVYGNISCPVPQLPGIKQSGTMVQVDVLLLLRSDDDDNDAMMTRSRLDKSFYVNHLSGGGQSNLSRSTVVIRYYPSERDHRVPLCGCNAFERGSILSCDDLGICGGRDGDKAFLDCAGTLFGSAVKSTYKQKCTGGFSMVSEDFSCFKAVSPSSSSSIMDLVKQTIVLLVLICSLCCITYGVSNIARHMTTAFGQDSDHRQNNEQADQFILNMTLQEEHTGLPSLRGMSAFERNALGSVVFSKQLLQEWAEEGGQRSSSSNDNSTATPSQSESTEEKKIMTYSSCDCSICLCSIEEGQLCRRLPLPCGHLFHLGCIDEWLKQSVHCPLCKRSAMHLLMRPEQIVSGSSDGDVRNHQRFLQLIRLAEDSDVEQLVRLSAHPEGRLNPYFAPHAILGSTATAAGGVDATTTTTTTTNTTTGYHAVTIDSDDMTAPNGSNEYVSLRATVRSMHRYRRYMLEAALAASDNESRSSSSSV